MGVCYCSVTDLILIDLRVQRKDIRTGFTEMLGNMKPRSSRKQRKGHFGGGWGVVTEPHKPLSCDVAVVQDTERKESREREAAGKHSGQTPTHFKNT